MSLLVYPDDDAADLTDLGISVAEKTDDDGQDSSKPSEDEVNQVKKSSCTETAN